MENARYVTLSNDFIAIHVDKNNSSYDIATKDCKTAKDVCHWLGQIAEKTWATPEILGELVLAFNEVNGDLRGFL